MGGITVPLSRGQGLTISELLMRQGAPAARAAEQSGAIWSGVAQNLGNIGAGVYQQHQAQKSEQQRAEAFSQLMEDPGMFQSPGYAMRALTSIGYDVPQAFALAKGFKAFGDSSKEKELDPTKALPYARDLARGYVAAGEQERELLRPALVQWATNAQLDPGGQLGQLGRDEFLGYAQSIAAPEKGGAFQHVQTAGGIRAFDPRTGDLGPVLAQGKAPALRTVTTAQGIQTFDPESGQLGAVIAQPKPAASLVINPQKEADIKENAQSIVDGNLLPSQLSKRSGDFNHLIATANRISKEKTGKSLSFTKLQLDYEGAKRFVGSMNSNQMVRFKGLAGSVVNTIDEVRALSEELKQGGVQKWNQAKRDTILQVYGNTPQSATAARYVAAVNTLKEEFANLAQGGYAPTEAAWKLANDQINGNFGVKDMNAGLTEVQRLINYRLGAFDELEPTLLGGGGQGFVHGGGGEGEPGSSRDNPIILE